MSLSLAKKGLCSVFILSSFVFGFSLFAQNNNVGGNILNKLKSSSNAAGFAGQTADNFSLGKTVGNYIKVLLGLLGIIFVVITVYAGFLWLTAGGNEDKVEHAKKLLMNGVIGLIIIILAWSIADFILYQVYSIS